MNTEYFLARRMLRKEDAGFSSPIVQIAVFSIVLGLAVMIVAVAVVTGFQKGIREKVIGFGAAVQVSNFDENTSYESTPISYSASMADQLRRLDGVKHVQPFAVKAGIIRTDDQIEGVVFKGIPGNYDWSFFSGNLKEGSRLGLRDTLKSDSVMVSRQLADKLKLHVHDPLRMYFILTGVPQPVGRKFVIAGIYETGLEEFDKLYVFGDLRQVQRINRWTPDQVSGIEVLANRFGDIDKVGKEVYNTVGYGLNSRTIKDIYPQIFDWLELQNMNVAIILALMLMVAGINMVSALLIIIIERTPFIGTLKAMGMTNRGVRLVFLYKAALIILKGMFWGNLLALTLCWIQLRFGIFRLNQESYYVPVVPVYLDWMKIALLNLGTFAVSVLMLLLPTFIITRITPVKAIRFA